MKRQIVAETFAPGASASEVARRHGINSQQLFRWRRDWREGLLGGDAVETGGMVPVAMAAPPPAAAPAAGGVIEIELAGGSRVRVLGTVDGALLRDVLEQLR